ncbi:MAG TPA: lipid carrier--UDP-N-acetylgalactosaminyltransferase [Cyanobacteria bacterium UBA8530]|nr:lipid carrier--UDP-N-acetylgalactosaminyltransferase [Cyanobacteria bacterium UBA8530]
MGRAFPQNSPIHNHPAINGPLAHLKRLIDILGASSGLILLSPLFLLTALAIRLESKGPALFFQKRGGLNGSEFLMVKFRSMYLDAEARREKILYLNKIKDGPMFKIADDPRITGVGRFIRRTSIDELPQLLNVLKGEMSLIGPRPMPVYEIAEYKTYQMFRFVVKPGLSGLWQVSGRSDISSFNEMLRLDSEYIEKWSLWLDLKILLKTIKVVLRGCGAC